ncbi:DUF3891 family protein [Aetokthonos hydrillicola Thurmond2011]|jgi:hypothetical protein|uniref:DUF3891 family protein n=1 Tax=Aetokthonos hydrillicola Thurmond2011 TaxID=2712845 RepID=A0AAP5I906_9CYAN|nr:DUF3891 family protein [Aetokthonos hydrillicola]MBO3457641.1 DUF3891 family protein [Aetokthonos hydrillicola CCALA 1050]MBW4587920.1 DUF3891 family protein [Aetokthonos hydrillicola CCALA 1050]MDR9894675.1 DUF3891 family protein [Aetokthonos hydrillicola Thurmond2011]
MIVNQHQKGWEVIYHRAHALLAAQIAGHWHPKLRPIRWLETIAAISHHDDLEKEWEGNHLTEAGAPLDFTLLKEIKESGVKPLRQMAQNSRYRGRWVAMLISMHLSFLNEGNRGKLPELDKFLDEQLQHQEQWRQELNVTKDDAAEAYAFFQWCDRLSLILCNRVLPAGERALEIAAGPDGRRYDVIEYSDGLTVKPWPFQEDQFTVNIEACYLEQLKFDNNTELTQALQNAPIETLEWEFVKRE